MSYAADYPKVWRPCSHSRPLDAVPGIEHRKFEKQTLSFLRAIRRMPRALFGADLKSDRATLEAAYNDALGVTRRSL
jgi:hypothetical protein